MGREKPRKTRIFNFTILISIIILAGITFQMAFSLFNRLNVENTSPILSQVESIDNPEKIESIDNPGKIENFNNPENNNLKGDLISETFSQSNHTVNVYKVIYDKKTNTHTIVEQEDEVTTYLITNNVESGVTEYTATPNETGTLYAHSDEVLNFCGFYKNYNVNFDPELNEDLEPYSEPFEHNYNEEINFYTSEIELNGVTNVYSVYIETTPLRYRYFNVYSIYRCLGPDGTTYFYSEPDEMYGGTFNLLVTKRPGGQVWANYVNETRQSSLCFDDDDAYLEFSINTVYDGWAFGGWYKTNSGGFNINQYYRGESSFSIFLSSFSGNTTSIYPYFYYVKKTITAHSCYTNGASFIQDSAVGGVVKVQTSDGSNAFSAINSRLLSTVNGYTRNYDIILPFYIYAKETSGYTFLGFYSSFNISNGGGGTSYGKGVKSGDAWYITLNSSNYFYNNAHYYAVFKYEPPKYTYTIQKAGSGINNISISVNSGTSQNYSTYTESFVAGTTLKLTANINTDMGYIFDRWECSISPAPTGFGQSATITITTGAKNCTLTVYAKLRTFDLTLIANYSNAINDYGLTNNGGGGVSLSSKEDTTRNTHTTPVMVTNNATIYARPNVGYSFIGWFTNVSVANNILTYTGPYKLAGQCNQTTTTTGQLVYYVSSGDMPVKNVTYHAVFVKTYTLTIQIADGLSSTAGQTGQKTYYFNQPLNAVVGGNTISIFNLTIQNGYQWGNWSATGTVPSGFILTSLTQNANLAMPANNFTVEANAHKKSFGLTVISASTSDGIYAFDGSIVIGGSVKIGSGTAGAKNTASVFYNETASITASASSGYRFMGWYKTVSSSGYSNPLAGSGATRTTEAMLPPSGTPAGQNYQTYYAIFIKEYTLTLQSGTGVSGVTGAGTFYYGQSVEINASINTGYSWDKWSYVSGTLSTFSPSLQKQTVKIGVGNVTLKANATPNKYTLTVHARYTTNGTYQNGGGGTVKINSGTAGVGSNLQINFNSTASITAAATSGYKFMGWYKTVETNGYSAPLNSQSPESSQTLNTEPMTINGLTYYAIFIKEYQYEISADNGIETFSPMSINYFYYGQEVDLTATVKETGYTWVGWSVLSGVVPIVFDAESQNQTIKVGAGNCELKATTFANPHVLNINEMFEGLTAGEYAEDTLSETVTDGEISFGTILTTLVNYPLPTGFIFEGFFTDIELTNAYTQTEMPDDDLELYAKFTREIYNLETRQKFTSASDNNTLTSGTVGGSISATVETLKFGYTTTLTATATNGFVLQGIYKTNVTKIQGNSPWKTGAQCNKNGNVYTISSEQMPVAGLTYYAVFQRAEYNVSTAQGTGTNLTVTGLANGKAFFGQTVSFTASLKTNYKNLVVKVFRTGTTNLLSTSNLTFTMPAYAVTVESEATPNLYTLTFNPNGGAFSSTTYPNAIDGSGYIFGSVSYLLSDYSYYLNLQKTTSQAGVPTPSRIGYKLTGWNTSENGNGTAYITYNETTPSFVVWDLTSDTTLFAVWEIVNPDLTLTSHISSFTYNGANRDIFTVSVNNFIIGKTYSYSWYNSEHTLIAENVISAPSNTLQLRSTNQSDTYYCVVEIVGETVSAETAESEISINKKTLNVDFGTHNVVGDYSITLASYDLTGLVANHQLKSGFVSFADAGSSEITYSEPSNYEIIIQTLVAGENITSQDGQSLLSNYEITYTGSVTVKSRADYVYLSVGNYEAKAQNFEDNNYGTQILPGVNFNMTFGTGFMSETAYNSNGTQSNYIDGSTLSQNLTLTFLNIPQNYKIHKVFINNEINFTLIEGENIKIEFLLTAGMLSQDSEGFFVNIKIYLTREALVYYNYGFEVNEVSEGYASFDGTLSRILINNSTFVAPTAPTRKGFGFGGWYYDQNFTNTVGTSWLRTGIVTIYAKWNLLTPTASNVSILVYDNGNITEQYTRIYNTKSMTLNYSLSSNTYNKYIVQKNIKWYKKNGGTFSQVSAPNIKNVSDSGIYSLSFGLSYKTQNVSFVVGQVVVEITINKASVTISNSITKVYDGTTSLAGDYLVNGVNNEKLKLTGKYSSPDVKKVNGVISSILLTSLALESYGNSNSNNYFISNTSYYGTITPYNYTFNKNGQKVYNGSKYSKTYNENIPLTIETQVLTFTLETSGANCGIYKVNTTDFISIINFSVKNTSGQSINNDNYNIAINQSAYVEITQAEIVNVAYKNHTTIFNNQKHLMLIENNSGTPYNGTLPAGAESVQYLYNNTQTTGFINAGEYLITAKIKGNSNYKDKEFTATLKIEKAKLSFVFKKSSIVLNSNQYKFEYSGIDIYNDITITTTNQSGTVVIPAVEKYITTKQGVKVTSLINVGEYIIKANFDATNYEVASGSSNVQNLTIITKIYKVGTDIILTNASLVYSGVNFVETYLLSNLILPEGVARTGLSISKAGSSQSEAKNVGEYNILINLAVTDTTCWGLDKNFIVGTLIITKFEITNANSSISATKIYDGKNSLPENALIQINLSQTQETLKIGGTYGNVNAGTNININNFSLIDYSPYFKSNYNISASLTPKGKIDKKPISIKLFKETNKLIPIRFTGDIVEFSLTKEFKNLVTGMANNEYITTVFQTLGFEEGKYNYSPTASTGMYCVLVEDFTVYSSTNTQITGGKNNYTITITGGIEILVFLTDIQLTGLENAVYNGLDRSFNLKLTTYDIINNVEITKNVTYVYSGSSGYFKDTTTNESLNTNTLNLSIKLNSLSVKIKTVGTYFLTFTSTDNTYIFTETEQNQITVSVEIKTAPIVFGFGNNKVVDYGETLEFEIDFTGQNNEKFYLNVSYDTSILNLNVGQYDFDEYLTLGTNITNKAESTADFSNYEITITGTFKVTPKQISATNVYLNLTLTYSGQNQINAVTSITNQFTGTSKTLVRGTDFWLTIKQNQSEVSEMISAGTYTAVLSSINYKFAGGSTDGEFNIISFNIEINKKALTISLYDNMDGESTFIKKQFRNEQIIFNIDETNNSYVTGAVNSEYITVSFQTLGSAVGDYTFSKTASSGNFTKQFESLRVFNSDGVEIQGGAENYNITFEGGIKIVYALTSVKLVDQENNPIGNLTYSGNEYWIRLELTTDRTALGETESFVEYFAFVYNPTGNYFTDIYNQNVPTEKLNLVFKIGDLPQDSIKNAGTYTLTLTSQNNDYIFSTNSPVNEYETNLTINKAGITFALGTRAIYYGLSFVTTADEKFYGKGTEYFNVKFNSNLTNILTVGSYNISTYVKPDHCEINKATSTAQIGNYIISITGTLNVLPREINVSKNYSELSLTYNGKNRYDEINGFGLEFQDASSYQSLSLILGTDYTKLIPATEIINAGTYTVTLSSQNYKFMGDNTSTENGVNIISFNIEINKANLTISLYDDINDNKFVQKPQTTSKISVEVNASNNLRYTTGRVNGEYIVVKFSTYVVSGNHIIGDYPYNSNHNTQPNNMTCFKDSEYVVYDINGTLINNGQNNYNITVTGGIEIVKSFTEVEFLNLSNLIYSGLSPEIKLKLSTDGVNGLEVLNLTYDYVKSVFINIDTEAQISQEQLTLHINGNLADSTNILKNAGIYTLKLISAGDTAFVFGLDGNEYTETIEIAKAPITFGLGDDEVVDYGETLEFEIDFTGQNNEKFYLNVSYDTSISNLNVGQYYFANYLTIENNFERISPSDAEFSNYEITITGTFKVTPKQISATNVYSNLTYSGQNQINAVTSITNQFTGTSKTLVRGTDFWLTIKQNQSEVSEMISAGTYTAVLSSINYKFAGGSTDGEFNIISFNIEINKKALTISLYDNMDGESTFIKKQFRNEQIIFNIDETNNSYVSGAVNSEYITVSFQTLGSAVGDYTFSKTASSGNFTKQFESLRVFNSGGVEIQGGAENYDISFEGGIEIVYVLTTVEFLNVANFPLENLTYNGSAFLIKLKLTTDRTALGETEPFVEYFIYNATGNYFIDAYDQNVPTEKLNLVLKIGELPQDYLKKAGTYTLTLTSQNNDYIFSTNSPVNEYETNVEIAKAEITFDLGTREIDYGSSFVTMSDQKFDGQGTEYFNVKFSSDLTEPLTVVGSPYNISEYVKPEHCIINKETSTAQIGNYIIIITGTLNVLPREITVSMNNNELELTYNGKNRYDEINGFGLEFQDASSYQSLSLILGTDYTKLIPATEIINAGTYTVTLSSQNYKFMGDNTSTESGVNTISFNIKINKANLTISLYDEFTDDENSDNDKFVQKPFRNINVTFDVIKENNFKYVFDMVNGEYLTTSFTTNGKEEGFYSWADNKITYQNLKIFNASNVEIVGGVENYEINIIGGIEIIKIYTDINFIWDDEPLIYSGAPVDIQIELTTYDIINDKYINKTLIYDYKNSVFKDGSVEIPQEQLSLKINDKLVSLTNALKNAGDYTLELISSDYTYVFGEIENNLITVGQARIILDLSNQTRTYGDEFVFENTKGFVGENEDVFFVKIKSELTKDYQVGSYSFTNFLIEENITVLEGTQDLLLNYDVDFAGSLIVKARLITVEAEYSNLIYNKDDKVMELDDVEITFKDKVSNEVLNLVRGEIDYQITYLNYAGTVTEIINAGNYSVVLSSKNYWFEGSNLNGSFYELKFDFKVNPKEITVEFTIEQNLVYKNELQYPVSYEFIGVCEGDENLLNKTLRYSNNQEAVRNAGTYTASVSINNFNYHLAENISDEFEIAPYGIVVAVPTENYFNKYFGTEEPDLTKEFTYFQESVFITFEREIGENVRTYSLTQPILSLSKNTTLILNNYEIKNFGSFIDTFKAFEILAYTGEAGTLIIKQIKDIEIIYDSVERSLINFNDYKTYFSVYNYQNIELNSNQYQLIVDFNFYEGASIRNAGDYSLILGNANSETHLDEISFNANGFIFKILKKELTVEQNSNIIKQYDKTSEAFVSGNLSLIGVETADSALVVLKGKYVNEVLEEKVNVNINYFIHLTLAGDEKDNYYIRSDFVKYFRGNILPREIIVVSVSDSVEDFNKEYDKTSAVETQNLKLDNVISGDEVNFSGRYLLNDNEVYVVGEYKIEFTISNSNYVIVTVGENDYTGSILKRELLVSQDSVLTKVYDGFTTLNKNNIILERKIEGDNVELASADFQGSGIGVWDIDFVLTGADSNNYSVESCQGEITEQTITIKLNYGDDADIYQFDFVDGNSKVINYTVSELLVFFGRSVNDPKNGGVSLPTATREGYTQKGWYLTTEFETGFFNSTDIDTPDFVLADILENNGILNLFAKWEKNEYQISIEVQTENNEIYEVSTVGGNYSINSEPYNDSRKTFTFNYYDLMNFEFFTNSHYEFEGLYKESTLLTTLTTDDFRVTGTTNLVIKFVRESYMVTIEMGVNLTDIEISGIPSSWTSAESTIQKSVKYNNSISLPNFVRQGYDFIGYSLTENGDIIDNTLITVDEPDLKFYANWQAKTYKLYFDYLGGEEITPYVFDGQDDSVWFIWVEFDKKIGDLPELSKQGYIHNNWNLTNNDIVIATDYDAETIWKTDGNTKFVLKPVWLKGDNIFAVSSSLNTDIYTENNIYNYNIYNENIMRINYYINGISYGDFTGAFNAKTEDIVQFDVNMLTGYYVFEAWYINGAKLNSNGSQTINNVTYTTYGQVLIISGFIWGSNCPEIEAVYTPFEVEVEIEFDNVRGSAEIVLGVYVHNEKTYTLTGAKIFVTYVAYEGYELIEITVPNTTITTVAQNEIMLTDFNDNLIIIFNFDKQSYSFEIGLLGSIIGVESIELNINNAGFVTYDSNPITIKTEDIVIIKITVKKGYEIINWEVVGSDATLGSDTTYISGFNTIVERKLSGFKNALSITVELANKTYSVTTDCAILNDDGVLSSDTTQNSSYVINDEGQVITSAKYLDNVTFVAERFSESIDFQSQVVTAQKYEFVGWCVVYPNGSYVPISEEEELSLILDGQTHYTAVFKLKVFDALFKVSDENEGTISLVDMGSFTNPQKIKFGENLSISVQVTAKKGYKFTGWNVTYIFTDEQIEDKESFKNAIIEPNDITNVRCNIVFEAMFRILDIGITAEAIFIDDTSNASDKISVINGTLEGVEIFFTGETQKTFMIKALAKLPGYEFDGWDISGERLIISSMVILSEGNIYNIGGQLELQFVGDDSTYLITAKFKRHNNQIFTTLKLENDSAGGIVTAENGSHSGSVLTSYVKTEESLVNFVYFYHGYHLDMSTIWEEPNVYSIATEIIELTENYSKIYSMCLKLTITGFVSNINITIKAERDTTTIHFYNMSEFGWTESSVTATIKYGTKDIVLSNSDISFLSPTSEKYHFLGWSTEIDIFDIYIKPDGELNFNEWRVAEEDINLYEFWELKRVKLNVEIIPENATILSNYYIELFDNIKNFNPIVEGRNYYFDIGAEFGISIPRVITQYTFKEYQLLKPNGAGGFEWTTIPRVPDINKYEYSTDLFKINSYNDFIYSVANQSGEDISNLVDGTMYVKLMFGIGVNIINKNYYSSNVTAVGGSALINNSTGNGIFEVGEIITITAVPDSGYSLKYWKIDGVESTETTKQVMVHETLSIEAVFVGNPVKVKFSSSEQGSANAISGGNIEVINNVEFYHVGDRIFISATPEIGYTFSNTWVHKATGEQFIDNNYVITAQDGTTQLVELTPIFQEKLIPIQFHIEGSKGNIILPNQIRPTVITSGDKTTYSFSLSYFAQLSLTIKVNDRYEFSSIKLVQGMDELNVSDLFQDNVFTFDCNQFGNVDALIFKLYFEKIYWYDYVIEKELVRVEGEEITVLKDLSGTGRASDPYKIHNIESFALWAYLINNQVQQTDVSKLPYNSDVTYYVIDAEVIFSARYWTPIGMIGKEFNGIVWIYNNRIGIFIDNNDDNYPINEVFDEDVLQEWGGLFGALSDSAEILLLQRDYFWYFVISGAVIFGIVLIFGITRIIQNKRKSLISSIDKRPHSDF